MRELTDRISSEGEVIGSEILKVDSFLNHQIDPEFVLRMGTELARRFKDEGVTKILTVEASGIAVAMAVGLALKANVVFAKKKRARTQTEGIYSASVTSFTRNETVDIMVSKKYLSANDVVLVIDDFLAHGQALQALVEIVRQSGARLVGAGIVIEKEFQGGGAPLRASGLRIESLVKIENMENGKITFG